MPTGLQHSLNGTKARPNRLTSVKDRDYHLDYAKYIIASINNPLHSKFVGKAIINWNFYKGDQWIFREDMETFLQDETGDTRNRVMFKQNLIRPMVEQYVGNAVRTQFNAEAKNISPYAITRRETELSKRVYD